MSNTFWTKLWSFVCEAAAPHCIYDYQEDSRFRGNAGDPLATEGKSGQAALISGAFRRRP